MKLLGTLHEGQILLFDNGYIKIRKCISDDGYGTKLHERGIKPGEVCEISGTWKGSLPIPGQMGNKFINFFIML